MADNQTNTGSKRNKYKSYRKWFDPDWHNIARRHVIYAKFQNHKIVFNTNIYKRKNEGYIQGGLRDLCQKRLFYFQGITKVRFIYVKQYHGIFRRKR